MQFVTQFVQLLLYTTLDIFVTLRGVFGRKIRVHRVDAGLWGAKSCGCPGDYVDERNSKPFFCPSEDLNFDLNDSWMDLI